MRSVLDIDGAKAAIRQSVDRHLSGPPDDTRPVISESSELHENVSDAVRALTRDETLFQRNGELVHVVRSPEPDGLMRAGTPQIRAVRVAQLTERLSAVARFERYNATAGGMKPCRPSRAIVMATAERGEWPGVRPLVGVLEAPALRRDGSVIQDPGYDTASGYLYDPVTRFARVPTHPTQSDANEALRELCEPWLDFPFGSHEAARYVPVAAVLSLLARPAIQGSVPAFVTDKSTRGSGGTLLNDTIATIATGREAARMTWPPDDAELEKILGAYGLRGAALINFDNVHSTFGGPPLDRVLTASDCVELRILGRSEVPSVKWRSVILASGNNVALGPDTTRRVLILRLEPNCERPEERTEFRHPDLLDWLRQERSRLVCAGLTILRAYVAAGKPDMGLPAWGSFEAWCALVPSAIVYAGGADVLTCRATGSGELDPETEALRTLLHHWPTLAPDGITAKSAIEVLYTRERLRGEVPPDAYDPLRHSIEALVPTGPNMAPSVRKLGNQLRGFRGRLIGGRKFEKQMSGGTARWIVVHVSGGSGGSVDNP